MSTTHLVRLGPADLADRELRSYPVSNRYVLVVRLGDALHAIDDTCNHAGCHLSGGWLEGGAVVCPCHEHSFDVTTGKCVTVPRLYDDQDSYPLAIDKGDIVVTLPERT